MGVSAAIGLYMETQYRSVVIGRWPPLLRFLVAQRQRLAGLVSSALAKVMETWLTKTPRTLTNGNMMPFRPELAEMALAMARTVQVEKGHGVMYLTREPSLYAAALAGAADLPNEVGNWALELAGRREVDADVKRRVAEVQQQKANAHAERLKADAEYRARHEKRKQMPRSIGSFRERLPPWPLGARDKVDRDFRTACIKQSGIQPLMRARPDLAGEVLLALITEDQPEREYGSDRFEMDLGLEYPEDVPNGLLEKSVLPLPSVGTGNGAHSAASAREFLHGALDRGGNERPHLRASWGDTAVRGRVGENLPRRLAGVRLATVQRFDPQRKSVLRSRCVGALAHAAARRR
jgi:hypothetical protein